VEGLIRDERTGKTAGVTARETDLTGRKVGPVVTYRAPLVIAADGVSSRVATSEGIERKKGRPMGVGVRTYFRVDRPRDEWMEGHLELWSGEAGRSALLPGYGWIFSVDDGLVNVGLGTLSARGRPPGLDHRAMLEEFIKNTAGEWGFTEEGRQGETLGAAIPMAFSRQPHYRDGLMLVGDSGGMVNPFNGEGIAYAMQAARRATEAAVSAREATRDRDRERALAGYARQMKADLGGYYGMGRVFAALIERPAVMRACTKYGLPRRRVMWITHKLLSDVYEPHGGDWADRILATLARVAPKA
jgi:flavin-dependent dehydrogenase